MKTSLFELFKVGIGPSSSHTVGPMVAARRFAAELELDAVRAVRVELFGSLALTGKGHGTDVAVMLGLSGKKPAEVEPAQVTTIVDAARGGKRLRLMGEREVGFDAEKDIVWRKQETLPFHPNGMRFTATGEGGEVLREETYYSVGGGFVVKEGEDVRAVEAKAGAVPYAFGSGEELLAICGREGSAIWQVMLANESALRPEAEVRAGILQLWRVMRECTERGMRTAGTLPGGLNVRRRAPRLAERLQQRGDAEKADPLAPLDWVSVFAIAVNEENAAGGRVVTAPTNGAAGIIPAVGHYYMQFIDGADEEGLLRYFLTAAAIGILYKENASISGAEVGCQGEVGVAASMAAAGLVAALGGTNAQVEHAAEIAMEHHLGMTCDPIGGLVQIPCIERNAMGAVKAINASRMAMNEADEHKVSLDQVIETMYRTGLDMQKSYKETSLAGLALNIIEC